MIKTGKAKTKAAQEKVAVGTFLIQDEDVMSPSFAEESSSFRAAEGIPFFVDDLFRENETESLPAFSFGSQVWPVMTPELLLRTIRTGLNQQIQSLFSQSPVLITGILSCQARPEDEKKRIFFDSLIDPAKSGFANITLASDSTVRDKMLPFHKQLCTILGFVGVDTNSRGNGIWANVRVADIWAGDSSRYEPLYLRTLLEKEATEKKLFITRLDRPSKPSLRERAVQAAQEGRPLKVLLVTGHQAVVDADVHAAVREIPRERLSMKLFRFGSLSDPFHLQETLKRLSISENLYSRTDVIALIRGGVDNLEVFNRPDVCSALSELADNAPSLVVTALGHAVNRTLADRMVDVSYETPSLFGSALKESLSCVNATPVPVPVNTIPMPEEVTVLESEEEEAAPAPEGMSQTDPALDEEVIRAGAAPEEATVSGPLEETVETRTDENERTTPAPNVKNVQPSRSTKTFLPRFRRWSRIPVTLENSSVRQPLLTVKDCDSELPPLFVAEHRVNAAVPSSAEAEKATDPPLTEVQVAVVYRGGDGETCDVDAEERRHLYLREQGLLSLADWLWARDEARAANGSFMKGMASGVILGVLACILLLIAI